MSEMHSFFKQQLVSLERTRGLKQYDRMLEKDDWEKEVKDLIDGMCRVCLRFDHIPNADKMKIIENNVITDEGFTGYNAGIIYKWLNQASPRYFKEVAHMHEEQSEPAPIVEGEERQRWLKEWQNSLGNGMKSVPQLTETEWKREGKIDTVEKKATGFAPRTITVEEYEFHDRLKKVAGLKYKDVYDFSKFKHYAVNSIQIFAANKEDAETIYKEAKK